MNSNIDTLEFLIDFVSALKSIEVDEINLEILNIYLNDIDHKIKEYPKVDLSNLEKDLHTLEVLNILKRGRVFKNKYRISISDETAFKVLTVAKEDDILVILKYASKYKVFQNMMTDKPRVSFEERYSKIDEDFVKREYEDVIILVKHFKEGK